jgi:hypothetical protein
MTAVQLTKNTDAYNSLSVYLDGTYLGKVWNGGGVWYTIGQDPYVEVEEDFATKQDAIDSLVEYHRNYGTV